MIPFFFLLAGAFTVQASEPSLDLLYPKPFTVITQNLIKIRAAYSGTPQSLNRVVFFATYAGYDKTSKKKTYVIGETKQPPYELNWDCSIVPDQDLYVSTSVGAYGILASGDTVRGESRVVFDRHPEYNTDSISSLYNAGPFVLDGAFDEWQKEASIVFTNQEDNITVYSNWDDSALYFAFFTHDENIVNNQGEDTLVLIFTRDAVNITFDPLLKKSSLLDSTARHLMIGANGISFFAQTFIDSSQTLHAVFIDSAVSFKVAVHGTLNQSSDNDTGYSVEIRVPWKALGIGKPHEGQKIGINFGNFDSDGLDKRSIHNSWAGLEEINIFNPSEWNVLVIKGKPRSYEFLTIVFIALILVLITSFYLYKRIKKPSAAQPLTGSNPFTDTVLQFIKENYSNPELSIEEFGKKLIMNKDYFRQKFKNEFKENFPQFLTRYRLTQAEKLLKTTSLPIVDISMAVGFSSPDYFSQMFKKNYGVSPSEIRNK